MCFIQLISPVQYVVGVCSPLLYCHWSCPTGTVAEEPSPCEEGLLEGGEDQPECGGAGPEGHGGGPRYQHHAHLCSVLQAGRAWRKLDPSLPGGQAGASGQPWLLDWCSSLLCFSCRICPCWLPHICTWYLTSLTFEVERLGEMSACDLTAVGGDPLAASGLPTFALYSCHHHTLDLCLCGWNSHHCLLHHHDATFQVETLAHTDLSNQLLNQIRSAEDHLQASHYSLLSTMEVAGKLAFASVSGIIIDTFGLQVNTG